MIDLAAAATILTNTVPQLCPAAQLVVRHRGEVIHAHAYGWLDPETCTRPATPETLC